MIRDLPKMFELVPLLASQESVYIIEWGGLSASGQTVLQAYSRLKKAGAGRMNVGAVAVYEEDPSQPDLITLIKFKDGKVTR